MNHVAAYLETLAANLRLLGLALHHVGLRVVSSHKTSAVSLLLEESIF